MSKYDEAVERQAKYDALTIEQKIERAKAAPGSSKRQLSRLYKELGKCQSK